MSEQALNLRRSVQIVRRHRILVCIVLALGLLAGAAYSTHKPPILSSAALVVLPQAVQNAESAVGANPGSTTTGTGANSYMAAQVVIASSDPVLSGALPSVSPAMSLDALHSQIEVTSPAAGILSIRAKGRTSAQAEATANAVAKSYAAYVGATNSPVGTTPAHILDPATAATGTPPVEQLLIDILIGAVIGALIGIIAALTISRTDRRLRECDEIAASIGVPVLAAFPVCHPGDTAGWTELLQDYKPGDLDAWRLRNTLSQLGVVGFNAGNGSDGGSHSLAVVSLSCDPGALALGPQLAVFAASLGIPTALVAAPQHDTDALAMMRTACSVPPPASSKRSNYLRVAVSDGSHADRQPGAALTMVVAVVDAQTPQVADTMRTTATVLGVSAGATTADQLARTASSLAADGREIAGILVADPEPTDRTTGRIPQQPRLHRHRLPARLEGVTTEIRR
jgi:capsular polysaccharide biosynthesis protein